MTGLFKWRSKGFNRKILFKRKMMIDLICSSWWISALSRSISAELWDVVMVKYYLQGHGEYLERQKSLFKKWFCFLFSKKKWRISFMTNRDWDKLLCAEVFLLIYHRWARKETKSVLIVLRNWFTWIFADVPAWWWI